VSAEHVAYIFGHVIPSKVKPSAKIDVVGVEFTGMAVVEYLSEHCQSLLPFLLFWC
jgi:hypothetical protein